MSEPINSYMYLVVAVSALFGALMIEATSPINSWAYLYGRPADLMIGLAHCVLGLLLAGKEAGVNLHEQ